LQECSGRNADPCNSCDRRIGWDGSASSHPPFVAD
jgi:hypothetical protein